MHEATNPTRPEDLENCLNEIERLKIQNSALRLEVKMLASDRETLKQQVQQNGK